ncbi:MAG TPA: response regulator [Bacteroidia bacterium]|nr:response regulator [Bacteroidia bacterium]
MKTQGLNLFIVDDNKLAVTDLQYYLQNKFGASINVSTFNDGESCLAKVDKETNIVILDYFMKGKNGLETLKSIKNINPNTKVIMLSGNEDVALAIETFREGATDYVIKGAGALKKVTKVVHYIITAPMRLLVDEFRVSKYMAMFLVTFVVLGMAVVISLQFMNR